MHDDEAEIGTKGEDRFQWIFPSSKSGKKQIMWTAKVQ